MTRLSTLVLIAQVLMSQHTVDPRKVRAPMKEFIECTMECYKRFPKDWGCEEFCFTLTRKEICPTDWGVCFGAEK